MKLIAILLVANCLLASTRPAPIVTAGVCAANGASLEKPITARDIEFFLTVAYGEGPGSERQTLRTWDGALRVRIIEGQSKSTRATVGKVLREINGIAGRSVFVDVDSGENVQVRIVAPAYYADLVPAAGKSRLADHQMLWDNTGRFTSATLILRADAGDYMMLSLLRHNLARITGLVYSTTTEKQSAFYRSGFADEFQPVDRAALRIMAENSELRGKTMSEARAILTEKYLGKH